VRLRSFLACWKRNSDWLHPACAPRPGSDRDVQLGLDHRPNVAVALGIIDGELVGIDAEEVIGG